MLKKPSPIHVPCVVQTGKLGHRIRKASYKNTQITRGGHRTRTHVCLTPNPVFFCSVVPRLLGVCRQCQSLGRSGGRKAVHIGGRSQEQLEFSWLESRGNKHRNKPQDQRDAAMNKGGDRVGLCERWAEQMGAQTQLTMTSSQDA